MIHKAVTKGEAIRFDCARPEQMNRMKYQFNRILKATTVLISECGGEFVGLRGKVKVCEDWKHMAIVLEPATPSELITILPALPNEYDAIEKLGQFEGIMDLVKFTPTASFDLAEWQLALNEIGFDLMANPDEPGWIGEEYTDGSVEYAVARTTKKQPTGFNMLTAYGRSGDIQPES